MTSISLLGTAYVKRLPLTYARHLRTIYTQSTKNANELHNISLKTTQIAQSILLSEKAPKGFEKYFPNSQKSSSSTEKKDEGSQNPFDFKKFSSTGGGGGSGGEKNSDDK